MSYTEADRAYGQSERGKEVRRLYRQSDKGRAATARENAHPETKERKRRWAKTEPARLAAKAKYQRYKAQTLTHYGEGYAVCVACGISDLDILTLDHIHGGGHQHRRELKAAGITGPMFYKWLTNIGYPEGYRTLCWNCQWLARLGKLDAVA